MKIIRNDFYCYFCDKFYFFLFRIICLFIWVLLTFFRTCELTCESTEDFVCWNKKGNLGNGGKISEAVFILFLKLMFYFCLLVAVERLLVEHVLAQTSTNTFQVGYVIAKLFNGFDLLG